MAILTSNWSFDLILILAGLLALLYLLIKKRYNYWHDRGIPHLKPIPFFGNYLSVLKFEETVGTMLTKAYNQFDTDYFGIYILHQPNLVLRSPELIKKVLVKDFNYFCDRNLLINKRDDPSCARMLFFMKNPEWKQARTGLSPVFTSGKVKNMMHLIFEVGDNLTNYISREIKKTHCCLEAKEICAKFATDAVASCAFGLSAQSFDNENAVFRKMGKILFDFNFTNGIRQMSYFFTPIVAQLFRLPFLEPVVTAFMTDVLVRTIADRESTGYTRNDLVDVIIKMKNKFAEEDLVANAYQFFAAGFETTSSTIGFALYELAINEEIQNKLRTEIRETIENHGELSYEALQEMKYLHMVICETLRKYPVLPFLNRLCVADYQIPDTDVVIEKGTSVLIPMFGIQYDPKYFPNPDVFRPERFSEQNKQNVLPFTFIPFGDGPRICIGERFGMMMVKTAITKAVLQFQLSRCSDTPVPIEFETKTVLVASKVGLPIKFSKL